MSSELILFDIPSRNPRTAWSLNPWKTRFMLNYKRIPYKTVWLEYPDLKPTLESHLSPQSTGFAEYTSPTVAFPDGLYVADSAVIRREIEKRFPEPTCHLDAPVVARLDGIMAKLGPILSPIYIPLIPKRVLNETSHEHWYRTREARFGMSLDRVATELGGQIAWDKAKPLIDEVTAMLKESDGPFFLGETISYADFIWGGLLIFLQRIGMDIWQDLQRTAGEGSSLNSKLLMALSPHSLRDDR